MAKQRTKNQNTLVAKLCRKTTFNFYLFNSGSARIVWFRLDKGILQKAAPADHRVQNFLSRDPNHVIRQVFISKYFPVTWPMHSTMEL